MRDQAGAFEDFAIILQEMGGVNAFADYEQRMRDSGQVASAPNLISDLAPQNLVKQKLGLQEVSSVQLQTSDVQMTGADATADEVTQGAAVETLVAEAQTTEGATDPTIEKDYADKQAEDIHSSSTSKDTTLPTSSYFVLPPSQSCLLL